MAKKPGVALRLVALAALSIIGASTAAFAGAEPSAVGSIAVGSHPLGAEVFLDGRRVGVTPLRVDGVVTGPHRVTIVGAGHLVNSRMLAVEGGRTVELDVVLTERRARQVERQREPDESGGGVRKALLIGLGAGAAGAGVWGLTRDSSSDDPCRVAGGVQKPGRGLLSPSGIAVTPSTGLASATSISFSWPVTDSAACPLTFSWDFGDGASAVGSAASHTYADAGTYTVRLTVSDGRESATGSASVTIRDLSGTWTGTLSLFQTTLSLSQSDAFISGTYVDQLDDIGTVNGTVSAPRGVSFTVSFPGFEPFTFTGSADGDVNELTGVVNGSGFSNDSWTLNR